MSVLNSVFFLLLSLAALSHFANADLIAVVCTKSLNATFCENALRADHRAPKADLKKLAQISIDISRKSAKSGLTLVNSLLQQAKDQISKEIYETCVENYDNAVASCDGCTDALKMGDYFSLNSQASAVMTEPCTCDDSFNEFSLKEPPQVAEHSKNLQGLCDIILAISVKLKGP